MGFAWDASCEAVFEEIKQYLIFGPILAFPKLNDSFIVKADASDYATGGILSKKGEERMLHPLPYFSTSSTNTQRQWAPVTKQAHVLVLAVRHWHAYLLGTDLCYVLIIIRLYTSTSKKTLVENSDDELLSLKNIIVQ